MEIKIPKEVRSHKETLFFGLSARQFFCSALAVGAAVGVYLLLNGVLGKETASWLCILAAAPLAVAGFFQYNGMTFEQFVWAVIKSELLYSRPRVFQSENLYLQAMDAAAKKKKVRKKKGGMSDD
ncbi:MAG: PrgI family protein [Ruminococcus flavefaciens]|nr:PrgI family protein [Ruminococcus flavefaciens]